jgi:hypothetical protein
MERWFWGNLLGLMFELPHLICTTAMADAIDLSPAFLRWLRIIENRDLEIVNVPSCKQKYFVVIVTVRKPSTPPAIHPQSPTP